MTEYALVRARVTDTRDPDGLGRVRVRYPWFGDNEAGKQQSEWAPVLREVCHAGAGVWTLPDVGDDVMVGFEFGRHSSPVVMGSLYTTKNRPPASGRAGDGNADGNNTLKFVKTRSGHLLVFDDSDDQGSITIRDRGGCEVVMTSAAGELKLRDTHDNTITLGESGVTIESATKIALGQGAAEALVKGKTFMQLFNSHTHSTAMGPSGPPAVQMIAEQHLSQKVSTK